MSHLEQDVASESSDDEVVPSSLNHNAAPYVPQVPEVPNVVNEDEDLSATNATLSAPLNVLNPTPDSPRRHLHMVKAHPPTQMLSSTNEGIQTRSSYATLIANHYVSYRLSD